MNDSIIETIEVDARREVVFELLTSAWRPE
jgi:hypothetical protein